ncbi:MAG: hypothetical protein US83_C0001G0016 [Candidatus Falkowbacteria bacterium GW2011_GWC2_38_22]|uniref:AmmeMemoRadiSam system protein B n=1 Tax=Candidatus Falkowbacteria bacterium GW2011_GWE1_38_31 TaxID=1618638 RepID=A0A0G0JWA6_9BACT|nr:MAG: hypothetical protein US73_C0004G0112 [Candidatus Falkowbacteria bacterium GW2011_GWF2_38_1205]KKQ62082.1 MAG: hypothetical protein US83_C0001G0016 [Candidatus Falkowbacteria bacterium GW2011_GWC2_38_22]KKQ64232.1 MAG: hypothetical protein US84_C0001G0016 [Candidatus Falkowbacteria bacterium GW2011_GWF1_38_22]KKQ66209.1 MAG: hypothetical protein US87_C0002G0016 [Candidatus Falkowbacteria bacterium GW2011_GWE2_38_254]KKQ70937.1 MAG: hypothetical protein US91_C0002G0016 [Candidatus Falkowb
MKKILIIIILLSLVTSASASNLDYDYKQYKGLIESEMDKVQIQKSDKHPVAGVTSHHLPTAAPLIARFYAELKKRRPDIKRFVVIGPDHFEKCRKNFSQNKNKLQTAFGDVKADDNIVLALEKMGANTDDKCFYNEHAIGVQANFIKKYFPDATLNSVILSNSARSRNFMELQKYLAKNQDIFLVLSLDFSHYQTKKVADKIDTQTKKKMEKLDSRGLGLENVDSPGGLKLILDYAKQNKLKSEIFLHKNSAEYDGDRNYTTSYFDVFFN